MKLTKAQRETAKDNNIPLDQVHKRIANGWSMEKATTQPIRKVKKRGGMYVGDTFVTPEQLRVAAENGLSKDVVRQRIYKGARVLDAITAEKFVPFIEKTFTKGDHQRMKDNGLTPDCVYQRIQRGWGKDKALDTPIKGKHRDTDDDPLEVIGRLKYLNRTEFKDFPMPYPKTELRKLKQRGLTLDDVAEVKA